MDEPTRTLTRADLLKLAAAAGAKDRAKGAAAERAAIAETTIPSTIGWFNRLCRWANERRRELVQASLRAVDALYRRARRARTLEPQRVVWHRFSVRRDDGPPPITTLIADSLARHAPPVRALIPFAREARAA